MFVVLLACLHDFSCVFVLFPRRTIEKGYLAAVRFFPCFVLFWFDLVMATLVFFYFPPQFLCYDNILHAVLHDCLLVLITCSVRFECIYIYSSPSLFGVVVVLCCLFCLLLLPPHFANSNFTRHVIATNGHCQKFASNISYNSE